MYVVEVTSFRTWWRHYYIGVIVLTTRRWFIVSTLLHINLRPYIYTNIRKHVWSINSLYVTSGFVFRKQYHDPHIYLVLAVGRGAATGTDGRGGYVPPPTLKYRGHAMYCHPPPLLQHNLFRLVGPPPYIHTIVPAPLATDATQSVRSGSQTNARLEYRYRVNYYITTYDVISTAALGPIESSRYLILYITDCYRCEYNLFISLLIIVQLSTSINNFILLRVTHFYYK